METSDYRNQTILISLLVIVLAFGLACGGGGGGGEDASGDKSWTVMIYMGADNNLSLAGLVDLNEMETVGSNDDINIVLQAEFSTYYTDFANLGLNYSGDTLRFLVSNDENEDTVDLSYATSIGNVDMGDPNTLKLSLIHI